MTTGLDGPRTDARSGVTFRRDKATNTGWIAWARETPLIPKASGEQRARHEAIRDLPVDHAETASSQFVLNQPCSARSDDAVSAPRDFNVTVSGQALRVRTRRCRRAQTPRAPGDEHAGMAARIHAAVINLRVVEDGSARNLAHSSGAENVIVIAGALTLAHGDPCDCHSQLVVPSGECGPRRAPKAARLITERDMYAHRTVAR